MSSSDPRAVRIRENQRRSRARKREYLESLEARLRRCQEEGACANSQIQSAARRVADENRVLREMLRERGVADVDGAVRERLGATTPQEESQAPGGGEWDFVGQFVDLGGAEFGTEGEQQQQQQQQHVVEQVASPVSVDPSMTANTAPTCCASAQAGCPPMGLYTPLPLRGCPPPQGSTTSCTQAYKLLAALNQRRQHQRDMFEIALELWSGFMGPDGEDDECKVDDEVLCRVVEGLVAGR